MTVHRAEHTLRNKLRVIYLPFLIIAVSCVSGYSFLNWLLLIKGELLVLDEEVVNFWLPFSLPWIPILIWLRPRLKALRLAGGKGRFHDFLLFVAAFAIAAPTIVSQFFLATAAGEISNIERIGQIDHIPRTKYYAVRNVFPDKANASRETRVNYGGKHNEYLNIAVFLACPLYDSADARTPVCNLWLATVFKEQISSGLPDSEREATFRDFVKASLANYDRMDLRRFSYLERVGASDEGRGFEAAVRRNSHYRPGSPSSVLKSHDDNFDARNGNKLAWVFGSFGIGAIIWLLMLMAAPVDQAEMNRLLSGGKVNSDGLFKWCFFLLPKRVFFFTPLLIDLNVLVFLGMVFAGLDFVSFSRSDLLALGGNFRPAVLDGEIWRLVTSMFIHGGVMHLAGNVFGLLLVGVLLEPALGPVPFAICYFVCGVGGSIASVVWHKATVSIGASGAIFGLWGVLLGLSFLKSAKVPIGRKEMIKAALFILGYNLLIGLVSGGIDNADHLGGLVCGMLIGVLGGIFPNLLGHGRISTRSERKRTTTITP